MIPYLMIGIAVIAEVFGDSMMKLSNGFKRKLPLVGTAAGYGVAFYLIAGVLEQLPLGPVYAAWTGLGIALTAVVGAVVCEEGPGSCRHHRRRRRAEAGGVACHTFCCAFPSSPRCSAPR